MMPLGAGSEDALPARRRNLAGNSAGNLPGNYRPSRTKIMGPGWGRTAWHWSAAPNTRRHATCPLTCRNCLGEHQSAPSDKPSVGLLIRRLGFESHGAHHL